MSSQQDYRRKKIREKAGAEPEDSLHEEFRDDPASAWLSRSELEHRRTLRSYQNPRNFKNLTESKKRWIDQHLRITKKGKHPQWSAYTEARESEIQSRNSSLSLTTEKSHERRSGNIMSNIPSRLMKKESGDLQPKKSVQSQNPTASRSNFQKASFVAGTIVKTGLGERSIETISKGDLVLSRNPETGEESYKKVINTLSRNVNEIFHIEYSDGSVVETTWNHPFYIDGKDMVEAKDLVEGNNSILAEGNRILKIVSVERSILEQQTPVYNFEVEDNHTYFVGKQGIWVHNDPADVEHAIEVNRQREAREREEVERAFGEGAYERFKKGQQAAWPFLLDSFLQHFKELPLDIIDLLRPRGPIVGALIHAKIEQEKIDYYIERSGEINRIIEENDFDPAFATGLIEKADEFDYSGRALGFAAEFLAGYAVERAIFKGIQFLSQSRSFSPPRNIPRYGNLSTEIISGSKIEHLNGALGEIHGFRYALDELGHIGIKGPGKVTAPGFDFATYSRSDNMIFLWDAKYRSSGKGFPTRIPPDKVESWTRELTEYVNRMPESQMRTKFLNAINEGRIQGEIFTWPRN